MGLHGPQRSAIHKIATQSHVIKLVSYVHIGKLMKIRFRMNTPVVSQVWEHRLVRLFCKPVQ